MPRRSLDQPLPARETGASTTFGVMNPPVNDETGTPAYLRRRRGTLASIAAEVGVSRTTVSNAYNRPDQLSAALRQRVLEAARDLGYPGPDPLARGLRRGRAASPCQTPSTRVTSSPPPKVEATPRRRVRNSTE